MNIFLESKTHLQLEIMENTIINNYYNETKKMLSKPKKINKNLYLSLHNSNSLYNLTLAVNSL